MLKTSAMNDTSRFNVLRWAIPDNLKHLSPHGMKVLKFEKRDVIIVWFRSSILMYDNINLSELQNADNSPGNTIVSTWNLSLSSVSSALISLRLIYIPSRSLEMDCRCSAVIT
jgi:hypothetical protein